MTALAISPFPYFCLSDLEMDRRSPSYTVNSLNRLVARGADLADWVVITGADAFGDIRTWKSYPDVLGRCHFAVVSRPDFPGVAARGTAAGTRAPDAAGHGRHSDRAGDSLDLTHPPLPSRPATCAPAPPTATRYQGW
jgi:nicotinic acid mononucleotide adenylyltransferase